MSSTADNLGVVRQRAEWMRPKDEEILEVMRDEGNMTPNALEDLDVTVANYASNRLSKMAKYDLVERVAYGLYRITDEGEAFLNEELDASRLDPADE
jgi:Mn-dependent DtxR family transcriptional regulator